MSSAAEETATIVIVGGGPHALAALSALHERSRSFPQYAASEQMFERRVGFDSMKRIGTVCVVDPGKGFMELWNNRFDTLEIQHLRSPAFAHPAAFEPEALLNFAVREGRSHELVDVPVGASKRFATENTSAQEPMLQGLPSTSLFRDFCASLAAELPHRWISGNVAQVQKDKGTDKFRVRCVTRADGASVVVNADAVILATGPAGKWNVPDAFAPFMDSRRVMHTEQLFAEGALATGATHRERERVLVVGGGITAAQAALAGIAAGSRVVLRSQRPLQTRAFDVGEDWLDLLHSSRLRSEFLAKPMAGRGQAIREAVNGGSVPEQYMKQLQKHTSSGFLKLQVDETVH